MSFYQFMLKFKDSSEREMLSRLATIMHRDIQFPKQAEEFDQVSSYLESNSEYSTYLSTFDQAWQLYQVDTSY
ncbi:TPA: YozE family protein [Streptococcus suis]